MTEQETWVSGLFTEIINEHDWKRVEVMIFADGDNDWNWSSHFFHAPLSSRVGDMEKVLLSAGQENVVFDFVANDVTDQMCFRKSPNTEPKDWLHTWTMMGPVDRAFIAHWKRTKAD